MLLTPAPNIAIIQPSKNADADQAAAWQASAFSVFRRRPCRKYKSSTHIQSHLKNFISNRREQPAWAAKRSSSSIPVFRSTRLNTSPGASSPTSSPTTKAQKASGSSGNGKLSVKQNRRKEREGKSKQVTKQGAVNLTAPFLV